MAQALPSLSTAGDPASDVEGRRSRKQEPPMQPPIYSPSRFARLRLSDMPPNERRAVIAGLTASALLFLVGFVFAGGK